MDQEQEYLEPILPYVTCPAQYVGGEMHSVVKDWRTTPVKMAFAFPDSYEIGMSHLGLRLLYETVNWHTPHLLERAFMPLDDMAAALKQRGLPLATLESRRPLGDFDIVGFTLQYELSYTNLLAMLDLAGLPLTAAARDESWPLIIAGGPAAYNPEPLADILDLVLLGEGEQALPELLDLLAEVKKAGGSKRDFLCRALRIGGVYIPGFYRAAYDAAGNFAALHPAPDAPPDTPPRVKKRILTDFDAAPSPASPLLPNTRPVHDRIMLELMRGCTHGCRFCQAGMIYRPRRERHPDLLRKQAAEQVAASGYEDIALLSLSSADYTCIQPLMNRLLADHAACGVGVSLPSLRVDAFSVGLAAQTQEVRKSGITLAPEAGSPRLRDAINKGVSEQDILSAAAAAFSQGYTRIKLYFMIGLPEETDSDIRAIAELCEKILRLGKRHRPPEVKKPLGLTLGVASFVPKSHTPFQWRGQNSPEQLKRKQELLRDSIKHLRQVTLSFHDRRMSQLEAAFARGDRRLGRVLLDAYARGCHFDGWNEHFDYPSWQQAFAAAGLTAAQYAEREYGYGEPLPWSHLDCGVSERWLWQENIRAGRAELTPDCAYADCSQCGVCNGDWQPRLLSRPETDMPSPRRTSAAEAAPQLYKYRCRLAIAGPMTWLSHLDLLAALEKAVRRARLPIAFSQGFNPHMQISWGPAHAVGLAGESEYVDLILRSRPPEDWPQALNAALPIGLTLLQAREVAMNRPSLMAAINYAVYCIRLESGFDAARADGAIAAFLAAPAVTLRRSSPKGEKTVDIRPAMDTLSRDGELIRYGLRLDRGAAVKPLELVSLLLPGAAVAEMRREGLYISEGGVRREP